MPFHRATWLASCSTRRRAGDRCRHRRRARCDRPCARRRAGRRVPGRRGGPTLASRGSDDRSRGPVPFRDTCCRRLRVRAFADRTGEVAQRAVPRPRGRDAASRLHCPFRGAVNGVTACHGASPALASPRGGEVRRNRGPFGLAPRSPIATPRTGEPGNSPLCRACPTTRLRDDAGQMRTLPRDDPNGPLALLPRLRCAPDDDSSHARSAGAIGLVHLLLAVRASRPSRTVWTRSPGGRPTCPAVARARVPGAAVRCRRRRAGHCRPVVPGW